METKQKIHFFVCLFLLGTANKELESLATCQTSEEPVLTPLQKDNKSAVNKANPK